MEQNELARVAPSNRLLTIPEALEALRIGKSSFYKLTAKGEIRTLRLGGRTLVPEREIDRLISTALGDSEMS
ncbi:helix-turn-helix domain-containing protein [Mycobacterium sp.]|uniref:helix-turn-helix transcriptional regulator n=1 Tax=Mycobacterium sp. TaxID=1785 RepID=UPI0025EC1613|nr:helix-turn-helix domain-containing protein [Mycobacterium sp.]